ncbi:MAG TPA: cytochrome P450 [Acidimicrobiales bacterium]|nr:cytochrome P450 [Acidimicrobiales bacterium]
MTAMEDTATASKEAGDYDLFDEDFVGDPAPYWREFRSRECPVAHSDMYGGSWLPTRYADVVAAARDWETFTSSRGVSVIRVPPNEAGPLGNSGAPPITADPPLHSWTRKLLLPAMSPQAVDSYEPRTRELCRRLVEGFRDAGRADAAADYAQQIPVRIIGFLLGVPEERSDEFVGWVRSILEFAHDIERRQKALTELVAFLTEQLEDRRVNPGDDLLSLFLSTEVDGEPMPENLILGEAALTLVAGTDTTWSAIGSSLYHLASHPEDRVRMVNDPDVWPLAIEEFLRFYSPVTMARIATRDAEVGGCPVHEGDRVLMAFPAANRDEEVFERADEFIIDRARNRHLAFGVGIHRCAGSNLARMELTVALEEWLKAIPEFELEDPDKVTWAGGQVRGPRSVPVVFPVGR